jgi:hypothetical protein
MMRLRNISPWTLLAAGGGLVMVWSAVHGASISTTIRDLLSGSAAPTPNQTLTPIDYQATQTLAPAGPVQTLLPKGASNRQIGKLVAARYGWDTGPQWNALDRLWTRESNWSNTAKNRSSGAYGIPQALPPTKLPAAGQESGGSDPTAQITWGLQYIQGRYGDPVKAWQHETSAGWY